MSPAEMTVVPLYRTIEKIRNPYIARIAMLWARHCFSYFSILVVLKVGPPDQQQQHQLRTWGKSRLSGPAPDPTYWQPREWAWNWCGKDGRETRLLHSHSDSERLSGSIQPNFLQPN